MTTAIVVDNGLYTELALHLARAGWDVLYTTPWQRAYPLARDMALGAGFDKEGLIRVNHPLSLIGTPDEPDIWIFPDLYYSDLQHHLKSLGKKVWGCGEGDLLERDRWFLYETLRAAGQSVPGCIEVRGVAALAEQLKEREECYVKISTYRGAMETEHHKTWAQSKGDWYDDLVVRLGPLGEAMSFIIQEPIPDAFEIGWDGIAIDGNFSSAAMIGAEAKDKAYLGRVINGRPPAIVADSMSALGPFMADEQYRNFFSTEWRIKDDGSDCALVDATCRLPSPPFESQLAQIENLPEIIEAAVQGNLVAPKYRKPWAAQLVLRSKKAIQQPVQVRIPPKLRESLFLYRLLRTNDGALWVMPDETGMAEIGSVVGLGDTEDEAKKAVRKIAKEVDAYQLEYDDKALDEASATMQKAQKIIGWE